MSPALPPPPLSTDPPPLVLVVEDERDVARLICAQLAQAGIQAAVNSTGAGVVEQIEALEPRLIILDLMLPLAHGFEILRALRRHPRFRQLPVLVLTALGSESDRIQGLDLGADDYVQKPFSPRELAARVRTRLRAAPPPAPPIISAGPLSLDLRARELRRGGEPVELSDTEFRLLAFLMQAPGQAFTRRQIVGGVWAPQHFITDRAIDVYMLRLRAKLEAGPNPPRCLISVRGVGYRFDPPPETP